MSVLLLIIGLGGLWYGTEITIRGATSVARRLGVSEFIVGVAILSIGSDLPELAIAVDGAIRSAAGSDASNVIVGSAIGSTLGQIGLVLGISALLALLTLPRRVVYVHGAVLLGSIVLLAVTALDGVVTRTEGLVLFAAYGAYFVLLWTDVGSNGDHDEIPYSMLRATFLLVAGLVIVMVAAEVTVRSAIDVAQILGIPETVIALLLIGLGTSLPELSISVGAVLKGKTTMSVGNLIGSNIFDTLVPIGVAASIATVQFDRSILLFELPYLFILSLVVLFFFVRVRGIQRGEALIILLIYAAYAGLRVFGPV